MEIKRIKTENVKMDFTGINLFVSGIAFPFLIALLAFGLTKVPGFGMIGQLGIAVLIAVLYRQTFGYPEKLRLGIQFSSKRLLRLAIILYGLKLNINVVFHDGLSLLARDVGTIIFSIALTMLIAKWLKADFSISLLLGIGTGVCGAAAIAAVSPILKTKDEDTAVSVGLIALVGTVFAIMYTVLWPILHLTASDYGVWSGVSLHEIAHVALASAAAGQDALAIGLLAKLGLVLLLVPLSFILIFWMKRSGKMESNTKIEFPWFLIGFIMMSLFGSYILGKHVTLPNGVMTEISNGTTFILAMAMVGLGLNVSFKDIKSKALRPMIAMVITSVALSFVTLLIL